jgi:hypothetical protein
MARHQTGQSRLAAIRRLLDTDTEEGQQVDSDIQRMHSIREVARVVYAHLCATGKLVPPYGEPCFEQFAVWAISHGIGPHADCTDLATALYAASADVTDGLLEQHDALTLFKNAIPVCAAGVSHVLLADAWDLVKRFGGRARTFFPNALPFLHPRLAVQQWYMATGGRDEAERQLHGSATIKALLRNSNDAQMRENHVMTLSYVGEADAENPGGKVTHCKLFLGAALAGFHDENGDTYNAPIEFLLRAIPKIGGTFPLAEQLAVMRESTILAGAVRDQVAREDGRFRENNIPDLVALLRQLADRAGSPRMYAAINAALAALEFI